VGRVRPRRPHEHRSPRWPSSPRFAPPARLRGALSGMHADDHRSLGYARCSRE